jgi:hypothetical protein
VSFLQQFSLLNFFASESSAKNLIARTAEFSSTKFQRANLKVTQHLKNITIQKRQIIPPVLVFFVSKGETKR